MAGLRPVSVYDVEVPAGVAICVLFRVSTKPPKPGPFVSAAVQCSTIDESDTVEPVKVAIVGFE